MLASRLAFFALLAGLLTASGCDAGTQKNDARYQALRGTWEIVSLTVDAVPFTTEISTRYDSLQLTFDGTAENAEYAFRGVRDETALLSASGPLTVLDAPQSLALTRGPETVLLTYEITQSRRAILTVPPGRLNGSDVLLQLVLPDGAWSGDPRVELRLERL